MKSLKESILSDIDTTIAKADDFVNRINTEFEKLKKAVLDWKAYDNIHHSYEVSVIDVPNLLEYIGGDYAKYDMIEVCARHPNHSAWFVNIRTRKYSKYFVSDTIQVRITTSISTTRFKPFHKQFIESINIFDNLDTFVKFMRKNGVKY